MRKTILAAATAMSMAAVPAAAQDYTEDGQTFQSAAHLDMLTEDQRADYDSWDVEVRDYYITLDPEARSAWWTFDDDYRTYLYEMTADQRSDQWSAILAKLEGNRQYEASINFASNAVVQDVPMPRVAHDGEYPVCTDDYDDHCINAWAAGMRGPDVDRPLMYWPGESVTDMRSGG